MKKKTIYQYDLTGVLLKIWESSATLEKETKYSRGNITACCLGTVAKAYNFLWIYEDEIFMLNERLITANVTRSEATKKMWANNKESNLKKSKETSMRKRGVGHHMQLKEYKKIGDDNPAKREDVKEKISQTEMKTKLSSLLLRFTELKFIKFIESDVLEFKSLECNHTFEINRQLLVVRKNNKHVICTQCNKIDQNQSSEAQKQIAEFVKSKEFDIIEDAKNILDGKLQLDIYVPSIKFAIEYNGLRFHNTLYRPMNYHLKKTEMCNKLGIRLFHIFEDEWLYKKPIIESMIDNFLGKSKRIYARECNIVKMEHQQQFGFFEKNHLQGGIPCEICYGLEKDGIVIAAMSFSKPRAALSKVSCYGSYELLRFCNIIGLQVVGGASKLFKNFMNNNDCKIMFSYANRRWSNGQLYESLGFVRDEISSPNYWYVKDNLRKNRFLYRKEVLIIEGYDPNKSEREIMEEREIPRIYDCGNYRYVYDTDKLCNNHS